jgi:outer membrane protein OmpA-like peptidoglycan-associated protein
MKPYIRIGILIFLTGWSGAALATNCRLAADYYYQAKSETDSGRIIDWLNRSVQACPNFNAWYMLGLIYADQGQTDQALDAFFHARTAAGSARTEALALARQADMLSRRRQWLRALRALELAKRFHPDPVPQWLEVSLKNARIKTYHTIVPAADIAHVFDSGTQISADGRFAVRPAVNLPVHFDFDQAELSPTGSRQVVELGRALTRIQLKQWSFLLVGHTDERGSRRYNQTLSENRAQSVKIELEQQFPSLIGRLKTRGRGESELLYSGHTEVDHLLNRRVRVTLLSN